MGPIGKPLQIEPGLYENRCWSRVLIKSLQYLLHLPGGLFKRVKL
jgi:hypothetical protein